MNTIHMNNIPTVFGKNAACEAFLLPRIVHFYTRVPVRPEHKKELFRCVFCDESTKKTSKST